MTTTISAPKHFPAIKSGTFKIADVNGDNKPDMIIAANSTASSAISYGVGKTTISVALNKGGGQFNDPQRIADLKGDLQSIHPGNSQSVQSEQLNIKDVNDDGHQDIILGLFHRDQYQINILYGDGTGNFEKPQ